MSDPLFVLPKKTLISEEQMLFALMKAFEENFKYKASFIVLGMLWSHVSLEVGRGKECYNFNIGNIKRTKDHKYTHYKCSEIINKKEVFFFPPHPQTHFNAYESLDDSAVEYTAFLKRERYKDSLEALEKGKVEEYVPALKRNGYFTAPLERYQKTFLKLYSEYENRYHQWYQDNFGVKPYLFKLNKIV